MADDPWAEFRAPTTAPASPDPWAEFRPPASDIHAAPGSVADFFQSIPRGLTKGMSGILSATGEAAAAEMAQPEAKPGSPDETFTALEKNVTGPLHQPQTVAGHYGETLGEFAPYSVFGPPTIGASLPSTLARTIAGATLPALGAETAGQLTGQSPWARVAGAAVAPVAAGRALRPFPAAEETPFPMIGGPERKGLVDILKEQGVTPTAGQETGNQALRYRESEAKNLPISAKAAEGLDRGVSDQFTRSVMKNVGVDGLATDVNLHGAAKDIGAVFENTGQKYPQIPVDGDAKTELQSALTEYQDSTSEMSRIPKIQKRFDEIAAQGDAVTGQHYAQLRSDLGSEAHRFYVTGQYNEGHALSSMQSALDGSFERSAQPEDIQALGQARDQWKNLVAIRDAVSKSRGKAGEGYITPSAYATALEKQVGQTKFVESLDPRVPFAKAARTILTEPPQSGTAPRLISTLLPLLAGAGAGALGGGEHVGPMMGAAIGAPAAETLHQVLSRVAPGAANRFWVSPAGQAMVRNQAPYLPDTSAHSALARALASQMPGAPSAP